MKQASHDRRNPGGNAGFTLVELLAVLAIVAVLSIGVLPAMRSLLESSNLTQGGQILVDQIGMARQMASARNCTVQVRLIQLPTAAAGYGAIQLWGAPSGGATIAMARIAILPQSVVISQDKTKLSPLLSSASTGTMVISTGTVNYAAFGITPSGLVQVSNSGGTTTGTAATELASSTSYGTMTSLYLSIVAGRFGASTTPPPNYVTVQLNPNTGTALVFRP